MGERAATARLSPAAAPRRARAVDPASVLLLAYVGGAIGMWGTFYDTAWHRTLARDSFWSLPHLFLYGGGIVAWIAVTLGIVLASRHELADLGGPVGTLYRVRFPFGFALAGVGVAVVVGAAPVDIWFHATFGKDVLIWSPPHMQALVGGMIAAAGLLFAAAAQHGRGALARRGVWVLAMLLPSVHLIHLAHYALAHYTMTPQSRTPDFYPLLIAIMFPAPCVALARAVGPAAPVLAGALFVVASVAVDLALASIGFARYTVTPVVAVPALVVMVIYRLGERARGHLLLGVGAGLAFALTSLVIEAAWMAYVVDRAWPRTAVQGALPAIAVAAAASGFVGWVWGGFLHSARVAGGAAAVFGTRGRARAAALGAVALLALAVITVYRPQVFGPAMTAGELALEPASRFPVQEAVFWEALLDEDFGRLPRLDAYSEGIIDGIPLPIGPAWCASDAERLVRELAFVRFTMTVNDTPLDLSPYPIVRQRLHDGRECAFVGVISMRQRASRNRFAYAIEPLAGAPDTVRATRVDLTVVFKDP